MHSLATTGSMTVARPPVEPPRARGARRERRRTDPSPHDAQQAGVRAAADEAFGVADRNLDAGDRIAAAGFGGHELLQRASRHRLVRVTHRADDAVPAPDVDAAIVEQDSVL